MIGADTFDPGLPLQPGHKGMGKRGRFSQDRQMQPDSSGNTMTDGESHFRFRVVDACTQRSVRTGTGAGPGNACNSAKWFNENKPRVTHIGVAAFAPISQNV